MLITDLASRSGRLAAHKGDGRDRRSNEDLPPDTHAQALSTWRRSAARPDQAMPAADAPRRRFIRLVAREIAAFLAHG